MSLVSRIQKLEKVFSPKFDDYTQLSKLDIPIDPKKFYNDFGQLIHPKNNQVVKQLTPYQYKVWQDGFRYRYRLTIKSQKVGLTTSSLLEDFQRAVLPPNHPLSCNGKEILIIAQSLQHAKEHLYTLRKMIVSSRKYSAFLINKPTELLFRDEVTKVTVMFVKNPDNPFKPTRIVALGPKEGAAWSWKEVKHIHMSDVAASNQKDDSGLFGAVFSRLANTNGTLHIETPPRGQRGKVWEIYKHSKEGIESDYDEAKFKINEIKAGEAVKAALISSEFLKTQKEKLGVKYGQYFECEFLNPSNVWYDDSLFDYYDDGPEVEW